MSSHNISYFFFSGEIRQILTLLGIKKVSYLELWVYCEEFRPQGYKTFFMLNSGEHEIFSANSSWHFHIYYEICMLSNF